MHIQSILTLSRLLLRIKTSKFSNLSMSSGILANWFVPRFNSTMFTQLPVSVMSKSKPLTRYAYTAFLFRLFIFKNPQTIIVDIIEMIGLNLTLSLPVTRICVNFSTVFNDTLVAKGLRRIYKKNCCIKPYVPREPRKD